MSTVIDSLVVELGLDPRKFTEGQRDALAAFKKTREGADAFGKDVEAQGVKLTEIFGAVKKGLIGAVGGLAGGEGIAIVNHINNMDAATGRWAKTIGTNVENLSAWQGMIRQVGGSAQEATSTMAALQDQINNVRMGSGMFDNQFGFLLSKIGGAQGKNADQIMRELQAHFSGEINAGRMKPEEAATQLRWVPGMNQSMINLMLSDLKKIEEAARAAGTATKQSAEEAMKYQESLNQLSLSAEGLERVLVVKLTPSLVQFLDRTKQIVTELSSGVFISPDSWLGKLLGRDKAAAAATQPSAGAAEPSSAGGGSAVSPGGSTRGDRNNNPGNIKFGGFAKAHGATGQDERGFAIFPNQSIGSAAQVALVTGTSYSGLTLDQFAARYAEGSPAWERTVGGTLGIGGGDIVNNKDPRLIEAIRRAEGTGQGARGAAAARNGGSGPSTSTSSTEVNIGNIHVNAPNATDADGIAREIGPAMKRSAITSPANSALV